VLITPWGNFIGALIMFLVLGFIPAYIVSKILQAFNLLRIPREIELVGLDLSEYAARYMDDDDVRKAELDEARRTGLIRQPAE
jgi:ammonia channel protein AmtB